MVSYTPIFFDTEFILLPHGLLPLSLAFTTYEGDELYVVITDVDRTQGDEFVQEFVVPYLDNDVPGAHNIWATQEEAAEVIVNWMEGTRSLNKIELWANFSAHDHVCLTNLWGGGFDPLPKNLPHFTNDIQTITRWKGYTYRDLLSYTPEDPYFPPHHAMTDARDVRVKHEFLVKV